MHTYRSTLIALVVLLTAPAAQGALVAHWAFENNLLDSSGNGNHLSVGTGTVAYGAAAPVGGTASFDFDGLTRLDVTSPVGMGFTSAYTVAAWVKAPHPNASGYWGIFGRGVPGGSDLEIYTQASTNDNFVVHNRSNAGSANGTSTGDPPNDVYYHLAVTYDGSGWGIYYNGGAQVLSGFGSPGLVATLGHHAWVGGFNHAFFAPNQINGLVDEMFVFDQELTQEQINLLITNNSITPPVLPEPSTCALLGLGMLGLTWKVRRRRREE